MDGKGYPRGLKREQMSWQARMMAIADIFEALTAGDRPYKQAMTLSQALEIRKNSATTATSTRICTTCSSRARYSASTPPSFSMRNRSIAEHDPLAHCAETAGKTA